MALQVAAVMKNAQYLDAKGGDAVQQEMTGCFHAITTNAIAAPRQMVGVNTSWQLGPLPRARSERVFADIDQRLTDQQFVTISGGGPELLSAPVHDLDEIPIRWYCKNDLKSRPLHLLARRLPR